MSAIPITKLTVEEYIALDKNSEERYEYFDGEVFAMAGGSPNHSRLSVNVCSILREKLHGKTCEVFNADMRINVPAAFPYRYPDASVACGESVFDEIEGQYRLVNPILIIEVLSPSTENYDQGKKFTEYQSIESFREYLLIAQDRPYVIQYIKQSRRRWLRIEHEGLESEVQLESLGVTLTLAELYERVQF
ncbi:MAG: Uma2 family endonuclease [Acidobacteria bacterium]|nr:Uma2 family endonuclease [Acidobacteriota bacterium]